MASEEDITHSPKQMEILNKFYKRLKKERFVNNQSSQFYSNLGNRFVIPGIIITGLSSVVSFLATSSMLDEDEKQGCGVTVGVLTAVATIIQSMSASFGFQLKKDAFATSADTYDSLITQVEFEICNPNEDFSEFCNNLEENILKIKKDCKYLPPLHIHELWQKNKQNYTQTLNNYSSGCSSTDPEPLPEEEDKDSVKLEISQQ